MNAAHERCTGGKSLCLPTQFALLSVILHPRKGLQRGDTAGDQSLCKEPSGQVLQPAPCHEQQQNTEFTHPGCGNPCPRLDFAVPAGAEAVRLSEGTRCCVGRAEVAKAGSAELGGRARSNLRLCHLSQLHVDTALNMEMKENLL